MTTPLGVQERLDRRRRASKLVGGKNLATGAGREGLKDLEDDQLLDESDTAVGEEEVGAAGMKRPVLVAMGQTGGGIGPVPFAGVREDQRPATLGVEARLGLKGDQWDGRVGDGTGPARARQVLASLTSGERLACAVE